MSGPAAPRGGLRGTEGTFFSYRLQGLTRRQCPGLSHGCATCTVAQTGPRLVGCSDVSILIKEPHIFLLHWAPPPKKSM